MVHIRDNFMKIYDHSEFGILVRMQRFLMLLKKTDDEIYYTFEKQKLKPEFYAFRWLTLLLSQEFRLPDVLRLWDSLFADQERNFEFLLYICSAMIVYVARSMQQTTSTCLCLVSNAIGSSTGQNLRISNCYRSVDGRFPRGRDVRISIVELSARNRRLPDSGESGGTQTAASLVMRGRDPRLFCVVLVTVLS